MRRVPERLLGSRSEWLYVYSGQRGIAAEINAFAKDRDLGAMRLVGVERRGYGGVGVGL